MVIEVEENGLVLRQVYSGIALETEVGKRLYVCMRDRGFEMKINDGPWHLVTEDADFAVVPTFHPVDLESPIVPGAKTNIGEDAGTTLSKEIFAEGWNILELNKIINDLEEIGQIHYGNRPEGETQGEAEVRKHRFDGYFEAVAKMRHILEQSTFFLK